MLAIPVEVEILIHMQEFFYPKVVSVQNFVVKMFLGSDIQLPMQCIRPMGF